MKRFFLIVLLVWLASPSFAQSAMDGELQGLISAVQALRDADGKSYDSVRERLMQDTRWTPMDETGPFMKGIECLPSENVARFRLNAILNDVARKRTPVSVRAESMLNGEDPRYDYSLFERSVREGCSASYELRKRSGRQWFVIIPHSGPDSITASLSVDGGEARPLVPQKDGSLVLFVDEAVRMDQVLTLTVNGIRSDSFVIINHNMRDK